MFMMVMFCTNSFPSFYTDDFNDSTISTYSYRDF